jgi:integrase
MFAWAMRAGLVKDNPAALVPKNNESTRARVLSDEELRTIWCATASESDYDRIVRLLMLTGCRRDEIGSCRWSELAGNLLIVPEERTKTGIVHEVPLSELALAQLPELRPGRDPVFGEGPDGFSGWSRSKGRLDRRMGLMRCPGSMPAKEIEEEIVRYVLPDWGLHDFRRTLSTRLNDAGVDPHVVEAILGHAGAKQGVAGVYNRASYRGQKFEALALWSEMVFSIVESK